MFARALFFPNYSPPVCYFLFFIFLQLVSLSKNFGPRASPHPSSVPLSFPTERYFVYFSPPLPLMSRQDACLAVLNNIQPAHAVKTPRFRNARVWFFSIFSEAFGIILFFLPLPARSRYFPTSRAQSEVLCFRLYFCSLRRAGVLSARRTG